MNITRTSIGGLVLSMMMSAAAAAQTSAPAAPKEPIRVYTNASLGKPVAQPHTLTPAEWQSLLAHQFVYVPPSRPDYGGARVTVIADSTPQPYIPPTYPLSTAFYMSTDEAKASLRSPWLPRARYFFLIVTRSVSVVRGCASAYFFGTIRPVTELRLIVRVAMGLLSENVAGWAAPATPH
jgi:hypothetical protein